jgi:hypothetical protein
VASEAVRVINQAKALQDSGCFAIVLECIPAPIAAAVTQALSIPTIGIGAGPQCSGQVRECPFSLSLSACLSTLAQRTSARCSRHKVLHAATWVHKQPLKTVALAREYVLLLLLLLQVLVYHDLLGMMSHPHHAKVTPKFCKRYAEVGQVIQSALVQYRQDVEGGTFPSQQYSPYNIPAHEVQSLVEQLRECGMHAEADAVQQTAMGTAGQPAGQQQQQQQQHHGLEAASGIEAGGSTAKVA